MLTRCLPRLALPLALAATLAGCMGGSSDQRASIAPGLIRPSGVEGSWVDGSGVGVSTFAGGVFTTNALDNGNKLSEGTYRYNGSNAVSITGTSLIRQAPIAFNCAMAGRNQLNIAQLKATPSC